MKLRRVANMLVAILWVTASVASAKSGEQLFEEGYAAYMAANCAAALEPLYQASLTKNANKDRAHLYLAHCQSIFGQSADAAYNLDNVRPKKLVPADRKLYDDLKQKLQPQIDAANKLYFNATPYAGSSTTSPSTMKASNSFYGLSLGVSRPIWSVGAFYESFAMKMAPAGYKDYTQSMVGAQLGYFVLPTWHLGASYTSINASTDQLKSSRIMGIQTDYYITAAWRAFLEYYLSDYPTLVANTAGNYKYDVTASEIVAGLGFPIVNGSTAGLNGSVSYSSISLGKPGDSDAVVDKNLDNASRVEALLSAYYSMATASITYWSGTEVLGVRSRGSVVYNSTDRHKNGVKLNLGYTFNAHLGAGLAYGTETYEAVDVDGTYKDFQSATTTGMLSINW